MNESRKPTLMQRSYTLPEKILLTALIMAALTLFVYFCRIPNPNVILLSGLVLCAALFSFTGGIVGGVIMLGYTLFFFSANHSFVRFTALNLQKVVISFVSVSVVVIMVGLVKRAEIEAFSTIEALTDELRRENEALQKMSLTDGLTGRRNRTALRQDYDSYTGREVTVMMVDLDGFKGVNDTQGHEQGDRILRRIGDLLADAFGDAHCYRYGGDEFLVIVPDMPQTEFTQKVAAITATHSEAALSAGYVRAKLTKSEQLRTLIAEADQKMYEAKRRKQASDPPLV